MSRSTYGMSFLGEHCEKQVPGPPSQEPHLPPRDPCAEEAEGSRQLKRDNSMLTCEGRCQGGFGGCWSQLRLTVTPPEEGKGLRSYLADRRDTNSRQVAPKSRDVPKGAAELQCLGQGLPESWPGRKEALGPDKVSQ